MNISKIGAGCCGSQINFGTMDKETSDVLMGKELDKIKRENSFTSEYTERDYAQDVKTLKDSSLYTLSLRPGTKTVDIYLAAIDEDGKPLTRISGADYKEYVGDNIKEYLGEVNSDLAGVAKAGKAYGTYTYGYWSLYSRTVQALAANARKKEEIV